MNLIRRDDNPAAADTAVTEILKKQMQILSEESMTLHDQGKGGLVLDNRLDKLALLTRQMVSVAKTLTMGSKLGNMLDTIAKAQTW